MPTKKQRIAEMEKEFREVTALQYKNRDPRDIYKEICLRIFDLNRIKSNLEMHIESLHYYTMLDEIDDELSLEKTIETIFALPAALSKFTEDGDKLYICKCKELFVRLCIKIIRDCTEKIKSGCVEIPELDALFKYLEKNADVPEPGNEKFYAEEFVCEDPFLVANILKILDAVQNNFLALRKRANGWFIRECVVDLEKNYKMYVLAEIIAYGKMFKVDPMENVKFKAYISATIRDIIKKVKVDVLAEIIGQINRQKTYSGEREGAINEMVKNAINELCDIKEEVPAEL
ncbi:hypothetical protein ENBRE01_3167 [Enteropsectra breve]|nr:hypothetical protein ENBRE01_3167 [Enteropsectra breve]